MNRWDKYFYDLSNVIASQSKCLSRKVGAVIVRDKFIVSTGYNGPPIGVDPCWNRDEIINDFNPCLEGSPIPEGWKIKCPRKVMGFKSGEGMEWCAAAHAERNAIDIAARLGHATEGCILYTNLIPCRECAKTIIQAGIKEVVVPSLEIYEKTGITGKMMLEYGGVKIREYNFD